MNTDDLRADFKARTGHDLETATLDDLRLVAAAHLAEVDQHEATARDLRDELNRRDQS